MNRRGSCCLWTLMGIGIVGYSSGRLAMAQQCSLDGDPCADGQYCHFPVGSCGNTPGECEDIPPPFCPAVHDPVCGCDGQTYGNPCLAAAAGMSIAHAGPCSNGGETCGGFIGIPCEDPNDFCLLPGGGCCCDFSGTCTPIPTICPAIFDPVCGCDGMTYGNACIAYANAVSIDHQGPCGQQCTLDADTCSRGEYCHFPTGSCGSTAGVCEEVPEICTQEFNPVCGCDGVTYGNACLAAAAGVSVAQAGPCDQACSPNSDTCPDGSFCQFPSGSCGSEPGVCAAIPDVCPAVFNPVCGCDGVTYGNACEASMAGVSIEFDGPCFADACGGIASLPCDEGEYCRLPDGNCCCDFLGACQPIPQGCPDHIDPVCSCNGVTYFNPCEAAAAGESIAFYGPCDGVCGSNAECAEGDYCAFPPGTCGLTASGICSPTPDICPLIFDPVCGCDGQTYGNSCEAAAAGVSVLHEGECEPGGDVCGGFIGIPCEDPNDFCLLPEGSCCCDFTGICTPVPTVCPAVIDPVCGCDGVTYQNECFAYQNGISIDHQGHCGAACTLESNTCSAGEYCQFPTGDCGNTSGECQTIPEICTEEFNPVCGCDGNTYGNPCMAAAAGVSIEHFGPCEQTCSSDSDACPAGQYCAFPVGACGDGPGTCSPIPDICPLIFDPVCGCDGMTYGNPCLAAAAGVSIEHSGACEQACTSNADTCPDGSFCQFPNGTCGSEPGVCMDIPDFCPAIFAPVCGCDGNTYGNACEASAAGVSVEFSGPCSGDACGGIAGLPCDEGEYCRLPDGDCCCDFVGVCMPIPQGCPDVFDPVCGCDGVTYGNACEAAAAGQSILFHAACDALCGSNADCQDGDYCNFPAGTCGLNTSGVCEPMPQICPLIFDPVCGCDGNTYGNACEAAAAGVSVLQDGPCQPFCGGLLGVPCENPNTFCMTPPGLCCCDVPGECTLIPTICPLFFDPVCGCDGMTYGNACEAAANSMSIDYEGVCVPVIIDANPPQDNPYVFGLQPFRDVLDTGETSELTEGIGGDGTEMQASIGYSPIRVTFSGLVFNGLQPEDIEVTCTGGVCPTVTAVLSTAIEFEYAIMLDRPIPPVHCTTLTFHLGNPSAPAPKLQYQSQPGNVNMDALTNTQDLLALVQGLNSGAANAPDNWARYNVNRSLPIFTPGGPIPPVNTQDLLRLVQLLNGVNTTQSFNGAGVAACP